jgi:neuronal guanine nucleotide exchange factor
MDANEIALQETKYEMITSEASYLKFLSILETVFITSKELTDRTVLPEEDHVTLFSSIRKGW